MNSMNDKQDKRDNVNNTDKPVDTSSKELTIPELLVMAKGPKRNMKEFAEACEISPSTFSRILNEKNIKPLSEKMMKLIVRNADKSAKITIEMLRQANTKLTPDTEDNIKRVIVRRMQEDLKMVKNIKDTIVGELFARGKMIAVCQLFQANALNDEKNRFGISLRDVLVSRYGLRQRSSFAIKIQGEEPEYRNFILDNTTIPDDTKTEDINENPGRYVRNLMDRFAPLFLRDVWEPEKLDPHMIQNTIVLTDERLFECLVKALEDIKVNSLISLLLVNVKENKVVKEYYLPRKKKTPVVKSVFEEDIPDMAEEMSEDDI